MIDLLCIYSYMPERRVASTESIAEFSGTVTTSISHPVDTYDLGLLRRLAVGLQSGLPRTIFLDEHVGDT